MPSIKSRGETENVDVLLNKFEVKVANGASFDITKYYFAIARSTAS